MSENNYHFYGLLQITKNKEGNSVCFGNGEFAITSLALRSPFNSNSAGLYFRVKTRKKFVCIRDRRFLNAQTIMTCMRLESGSLILISILKQSMISLSLASCTFLSCSFLNSSFLA
mmetsp:Transcript_9940/g.11374  ORF Transcript_9940/g.11374 Transcript_9940/m.11374 type:complete len:116 (+) Transcript_9940:58-405(+)